MKNKKLKGIYDQHFLKGQYLKNPSSEEEMILLIGLLYSLHHYVILITTCVFFLVVTMFFLIFLICFCTFISTILIIFLMTISLFLSALLIKILENIMKKYDIYIEIVFFLIIFAIIFIIFVISYRYCNNRTKYQRWIKTYKKKFKKFKKNKLKIKEMLILQTNELTYIHMESNDELFNIAFKLINNISKDKTVYELRRFNCINGLLSSMILNKTEIIIFYIKHDEINLKTFLNNACFKGRDITILSNEIDKSFENITEYNIRSLSCGNIHNLIEYLILINQHGEVTNKIKEKINVFTSPSFRVNSILKLSQIKKSNKKNKFKNLSQNQEIFLNILSFIDSEDQLKIKFISKYYYNIINDFSWFLFYENFPEKWKNYTNFLITKEINDKFKSFMEEKKKGSNIFKFKHMENLYKVVIGLPKELQKFKEVFFYLKMLIIKKNGLENKVIELNNEIKTTKEKKFELLETAKNTQNDLIKQMNKLEEENKNLECYYFTEGPLKFASDAEIWINLWEQSRSRKNIQKQIEHIMKSYYKEQIKKIQFDTFYIYEMKNFN